MAVDLARLVVLVLQSLTSPVRFFFLRIMDLWDPMMQKALLINTAEDRGDAGWDKDWGWGYIDLYAALEQYDYTISDSIDGGAEKWYRGTMNRLPNRYIGLAQTQWSTAFEP